jgi:hypothetical protein
MKIVKWIKGRIRVQKPIVVAAWEEPAGEWGCINEGGEIIDGGILLSRNVIIEHGLETKHLSAWVQGPRHKQLIDL